jgi:hypothetical protein
MKKYKSPGSHQILAELIQAGSETLLSEIHKLTTSIWNNELPDHWKETIIVPIHKKGNKTGCSNFCAISLLSPTYTILSATCIIITLSPYIDEIVGDHLCGLRHNRSTTAQIFCIHQILEKKWEYKGTVFPQHTSLLSTVRTSNCK